MTQTIKLTPPPGYGTVVPLDKKKHAGLGLRPDRNQAWCATLNAVYVSAAELARAALYYPIGFAREPHSGDLLSFAVLGLKPHQNLFIDRDGRWLTPYYVPAHVRRHPFCMVAVTAGNGAAPKQLVCVQEDQLMPSARPLFDADGTATAEWSPIQKLLEAVEGARQQTAAFLRRLESLELLTPFDALALPRGGQQMRLQGLLRVDERKLEKLPGKALRELLGKGELRAVYAHLLSLENFARLLDLAQEHHGH
ncbi:MAG: SapC family protein [Nevskiales bacterium]|nr:SapC family protein [Nevskiales bacterium]